MTSLDHVTDPVHLAEIYRELLEPHFGPEELIEPQTLIRGVADGVIDVIAQREAGEWLGVAVGDFSPGVTLLSYLAVSEHARGKGVGSQVLTSAIHDWSRREGSGDLVIAEVEDPGHHPSHPLRGDPTRRFEFYARHGALVVDVPYFQPSLREGLPRVPHMLLVVLWVREQDRADDGHTLRRTAPLVAMLEDYFEGAEGSARPQDPDAAALFKAFAEGPVRLLRPGVGPGR